MRLQIFFIDFKQHMQGSKIQITTIFASMWFLKDKKHFIFSLLFIYFFSRTTKFSL